MQLGEILQSYQRYLHARIEEREFTSFGGSIVSDARAVIKQHEEAEQAYLAAEVRRRRDRTEDFKARLEAVDQAEAAIVPSAREGR